MRGLRVVADLCDEATAAGRARWAGASTETAGICVCACTAPKGTTRENALTAPKKSTRSCRRRVSEREWSWKSVTSCEAPRTAGFAGIVLDAPP